MQIFQHKLRETDSAEDSHSLDKNKFVLIKFFILVRQMIRITQCAKCQGVFLFSLSFYGMFCLFYALFSRRFLLNDTSNTFSLRNLV